MADIYKVIYNSKHGTASMWVSATSKENAYAAVVAADDKAKSLVTATVIYPNVTIGS